MLFRFVVMMFCMVLGGFQPVFAEDCAAVARLTRETKSLPMAERVTKYKHASKRCSSEWYREGMALMTADQFELADAALNNATDGAEPENRLHILGNLAENEYAQGHRAQALVNFKNARKYANKENLPLPTFMTQLQKELDKKLDSQPLNVTELQSMHKGMKDFGVEPTVDYRVLFDTGSDRLTPEAERQLQKVADSLSGAPGNIQVVGHTDKRGKKEPNQILSEQRARSVAAWLSKHNTSLAGRLTPLGKGMDEPKYFGNSDEDHQMNRRVEFVFSSK